VKNSFWSSIHPTPDTYSLFRGRFKLPAAVEVELRVVGAAWYRAWLDGKSLLEGPLRYALDRPEYQIERVSLSAGEHCLAFHVHHIGVETRILKDTPPYLWCQAFDADGQSVEIQWRCLALDSQASTARRINPQLGWIECRDTRRDPVAWEGVDFDDSSWDAPVADASPLTDPTPADLDSVRSFPHTLQAIATGPLATTFGYPTDEPAYVFHSRDRKCGTLPAKGCWRRYDLGRIRLGCPRFRLELPAGAIVEFALAEALTEDRVSPFINLSGGPSSNLDRFIARGGEQTIYPLTPKGGRFLEIHVVNAVEGEVRFLEEEFVERCYHAPSEAAFSCGDAVLEKIWMAGVETYRACAEDALTDNPTRERGQWVGDVAAVGMEIASVGYHDLRLCKRAIIQSALCPREDGLVAGMSPGGCIYLPTYAFQWAVAAVGYYRHTGDRTLLEEMWEPALRNAAAIRAFWHADGLHNVAGWNFVDWGYREESPVDPACNLHYLWCLRSMAKWARHLDQDAATFDAQADELTTLLAGLIAHRLTTDGWPALGYHCVALAMRLGLISDESGALAYLESHIKNCFPNDPTAPRNDDPAAANPRLITPYFAHYVMPLFIERGRMDFALDQFRHCWGDYMLSGDETTLVEVFDRRWSHCHQWSGCPTWQLTRYLLGLHPRFDEGAACFAFRLEPGSLTHAAGRIPHPCGGWIEIAWSRSRAEIDYQISTPAPVHLQFPDGSRQTITESASLRLPIPTT